MLRMLFALVILYSTATFADKFDPNASYQVCFTPAQNCTNLIVAAINQAKNQILVQAYSFTSVPIAHALIDAHKKGIDVKIILDRSQYRSRGFSSARMLQDYHMPAFIDYELNIAHNKVIIIDKKTVVTGSFNFTRAAQERNAENVIIISDPQIAKKYLDNWQSRFNLSKSLSDYLLDAQLH